LAVSAAAPRVKPRGTLADAWLWAAAAAYAAILFVLGYVRYQGHHNLVDLGIFAQTAASAFGCFCNTVEGSHWAYHFSPILYAVGAVMTVWHSALALVAIGAVAGALTAPPIYGIVARHAGVAPARLTAAVVLLYPPLAGVVFDDFHENSLAPAAVAWLLWAFDRRSAGWTALFAVVAVSIKEDQAIFVAAAGAIGAIAYRRDRPRRNLCAIAAAIGALTAGVYFGFVQPHAAAAGHWAPVRFYAWTLADVRTLWPAGIVARIGFLLLAFVPLLFLPLRTRAALLLILPFAEVLASRMSTTYTMGSHYAGAWMGWTFYAFALALIAIRSRSRPAARRLLYWCVTLCIIEFISADPLHPGLTLHSRSPADAALDAFIAALPPKISLATQEEAFTHLAATDPNVTVLPETAGKRIASCYILTDDAFPGSPRLVESRPLVARLVRDGTYVVQREKGAITLYSRRPPCS
jgi:uncharacterized membrane protein